ncbi:DUF3558 domain-containing protein [Streptomyces sp. NPDC001796]|uniref:DUF3558 domain-containing protein n=1 Tax=Streptomyces sp. NPDC001796 TaxID=3364609 RepID=UPI0036AFD22D
MSEGTMHRPAQRDTEQREPHYHSDQGERSECRPGRRGSRVSRFLVCAAAVPAVLIAAGCSSGSSGSGSGGDAKPQAQESSARPSQSASANAVRPAAYATLPQPCSVLSQKTLGDLVPKGAKSGKAGSTDDAKTRSSCSWSSLQNNGVKGSQFRWLNVSLLRFESDATRGDGNKLAQQYYDQQVQDAKAVDGAKSTKAVPVSGAGDAATAVTYDLKKKEGDFKQQTVVARVENVVVTVDYNGAGLAGDKTPDADDLTKAAEKAVKEVVSAVASANNDGGKAAGGSPSQGASKSASPSKSASASSSASASPAKGGSPSASASPKS